MKVLVRFDGKAFVPQEELRLAEGTEGVVSIQGPDGFEELMAWVDARGPLPVIDLANLDRGDLYP